MLFNMIKGLNGNIDAELDRKMTTGFESHLQNVVKRLNERLKSMKEPAQRHTEILLAKHGLYDLCFQELITYAGNTNQQLQDSLRKICNVHSDLFEHLESVLSTTVGENVELQRKLEQAESESTQLLQAATTLEKEAEEHRAETIELKEQMKKLQMRNRQLESQPSQYRGNDVVVKATAPSSSGKKTVAPASAPSPPKKAGNDQSQYSHLAPNGDMVIVDNIPGAFGSSRYTVRMLSLKQLKVCWYL